MYAVCVIAKIEDIYGNPFFIRHVVFVLPANPIPFLLGLQTARNLAFDILLREENGSHVKINHFGALHKVIVNSHVWIRFEPCNTDPNPKFNWEPLINESINTRSPTYNPVFHTQESNNRGIVPPWEKDEWKSKVAEENLKHLHDALRHPTSSSMIRLLRKKHSGRRIQGSDKEEDKRKSEEMNTMQSKSRAAPCSKSSYTSFSNSKYICLY